MSFAAQRQRLHQRLRDALGRETPPTRRYRLGWLLLAAVFLAGPFVSHLHKAFHQERPHGDWVSIYSIAAYSVRTGELEADESEDIVRTQRYPPITRPLLMLFALPPKSVAAVLSFVLFTTLYLWCGARVSAVFLRPTPHARWAGIAFALGLVLPYVWADLTAGNLTSVLLASVTAAFVLAERGKPFRAGLALSIGIMLKIIPVLCLLYFLMRRKWSVAWGVLAGMIVIGVLPSLAIFGPRKLWDYHEFWYRTQFSVYTPMNAIDNPVECTYQNQAVVRTMIRLFTHTNAGSSRDPFYITIARPPRIVIKIAYVVLMAASGLAFLAWLYRTRHVASAPAAYAVCVGSMLWFSPWIGSYYYSLALWPAAALLGNLIAGDADPRTARWSDRALLAWLAATPAIGSYFLRACGVHTLAALLLSLATAITWRTPPISATTSEVPRTTEK